MIKKKTPFLLRKPFNVDIILIFYAVFILILFNSCAGEPQFIHEEPVTDTVLAEPLPAEPAVIAVMETPVIETVPETPFLAAVPEPSPEPAAVAVAETPPERFIIPPVPEYISGSGLVPAEMLSEFLLLNNPMDKDFALEFAKIYMEEAAAENINHDIAFAQMCLETGFLRFGGLVEPEQNNFCGLGATGPGHPGLWFPDARTGVRAHIQHLKAYASDEPLNQELVNPRYFLIRLGSSPKISGLAGTWAADPLYASKINGILERLYAFSFRR